LLAPSLHPLLAFSFPYSRLPLSLLSFPTRRSSDLLCLTAAAGTELAVAASGGTVRTVARPIFPPERGLQPEGLHPPRGVAASDRSEEHTSELQSRFDLVCRLLLEKKKLHEHRKTGP